jgi:ribosomal protein S12 methylthiotransferase accessory factor
VEAEVGPHIIKTDQPTTSGGGGTAPSPFDLFLASIATCAGFYVLDFCRKRDIPTDDIGIRIRAPRDPGSHMIERVQIELMLPPEFPKKYEKAVARAAEMCSVKKHIENGLTFVTAVTRIQPTA